MKVYFFITIFIVIQTITCEKAVSKLQRKLMVPKMDDKCKKIKCASVNDPQCVRMRRHDLSITVHVTAANKCEFEYMKCHDDVEAKIVPMKFCSRNAALSARKKKIQSGKALIRVKRNIGYRQGGDDADATPEADTTVADMTIAPPEADPTVADITIEPPEADTTVADTPIAPPEAETTIADVETEPTEAETVVTDVVIEPTDAETTVTDVKIEGEFRGKRKNIRRQHLKKPRKNSKKMPIAMSKKKRGASTKPKRLNKNKKKSAFDMKHPKQPLGHLFFSTESGSDESMNERKKIAKGIGGYPVNVKDDVPAMKPYLLKPKSLVLSSLYPDHGFDASVSSSSEILQLNANLSEPEESPEFQMKSHEAANFSTEVDEVDQTQYDEECPSVCPTKSVMVCAKCAHGIYKTFNSVCHLKMFMCLNPEESLSLVSRYPCVLSSPYNPDAKMAPRGTLSDPSDDDKVMRFILCRERGQLGSENTSGDPDCRFPKEKERLKYFDYKGVQINMLPNMMNNVFSDNSEY